MELSCPMSSLDILDHARVWGLIWTCLLLFPFLLALWPTQALPLASSAQTHPLVLFRSLSAFVLSPLPILFVHLFNLYLFVLPFDLLLSTHLLSLPAKKLMDLAMLSRLLISTTMLHVFLSFTQIPASLPWDLWHASPRHSSCSTLSSLHSTTFLCPRMEREQDSGNHSQCANSRGRSQVLLSAQGGRPDSQLAGWRASECNKIPSHPWLLISLDFIMGLPECNGYDAIWVVIDWLTQQAHFVPTTTTLNAKALATLYVSNIVKLDDTAKPIISDHGLVFILSLWKGMQSILGTSTKFSTAYHPQTNGQTKCINAILKNYLCHFASY